MLATRAIADLHKGSGLRDMLLLEALALECVIRRVEQRDSIAAEDAEELREQPDRVRRIASIGVAPGYGLSGTVH